MKNKNSIVTKLIIVGGLGVLLAVLLVLKTNVAICEFFATTIARGWIWLTGHILGWIPISFYELFLIVAISGLIVCIVFIVRYFCKHKPKQAVSLLLTVVIVALCGVNLYTATASFSYDRDPLPKEIVSSYSGDDLPYEQALAIANYVVDQVNELYESTSHDKDGNVIMPSLAELNDLLQGEYKRLNNVGDGYFSSFTPNAKGILNKRIMSEMHVAGVFFAPFGESNVNVTRIDVYTPSTMAHELAHAKGVMRESDANTVSVYLLLTSQNPYLRYSGYVYVMQSALSMVSAYRDSDTDYFALRNRVNHGVFAELSNYSKHWSQYTLLDDIGEFFNNIYLKLQGQTNGTGSYVKPPVIEWTGEKDEDGNEIGVVIEFSNIQNVLINLYKQGKLCN